MPFKMNGKAKEISLGISVFAFSRTTERFPATGNRVDMW